MKKEELLKQINQLVEKENKIRVKRRNKEYEFTKIVSIPNLKKSVGKCFKYLNSYGSHYKKWFLYVKIINFNEKEMTFTTIEFQKTSLNFVEVKVDQKYNYDGKNYFSDTNYQEITKGEYNRAKKNILKFLQEKLSK